MAGKIEIHDKELSECVDDIVSQLREAYPDGIVFGLNVRHKALYKKMNEVLPLIGYESREDFLNAYGFTYRTSGRGCSATVDAEEIENAIDELGEIFCALPSEEKPRTITDLVRVCPEQGAFIRAGKTKGLADSDLLQELGILACTKTLLKKKGVRMVPYEELLPLVRDALGDVYIEPGDGRAKCLPPYIAGIDVKNEVELRCATVAVTDSFVRALTIGEKHPAKVFFEEDRWGHTILKVQIGSMPSMQVSRMWFGGMFDYIVEGSESKLAGFDEAVVATVSGYKGDCIAQIELKYLAALRRDTIIYALRQMGYVTEADVVGNMGWRFRLRKAARGKAVLGEFSDGSHEPGPTVEAEAEKKVGKGKKNTDKDKKKRKAEEACKAGEACSAEEERAAEEACKAEEARGAEEVRKAEEARRAKEEAERVEAARRAEGERCAVEEAREAEEARKAEEACAAGDAHRAAEAARKAEEARRVAEKARDTEEKHKAEAAQRAEEERRAAEEARKAEEACKVEEARAAEEARRAEAERQARISAQEEKVQAAQAAFDKAKDELTEFELRETEISSLESQVRGLEQTIAGLGFFKFGEKKAKRQELSEVMTKVIDLKKQNLKMADKRNAFAEAQEALNAEKAQLERL